MELNFYNWMLIFLRISAFLAMLPFFSGANFPVRLRIALGAVIALLLAPGVPLFNFGQLGFFSVIGVMFQEISVGLFLGFIARIVFFAVDIAGTVISTEMGLNMASLMNPLTNSPEQMPSTILYMLATIVMLTLDLHHWMLLGFQHTYLVLPIGGAHLNGPLFDVFVTQIVRIFGVALQISAPVMAVSFVVTVVFGVLSRAVPQMNVFILSASFRIAAGLAVFGFTMQLTAQYVMNFLHRLPDDLMNLAGLVGTR